MSIQDGEPNELRFYNFHKIKELFDNFHLKETYGEQKLGESMYTMVI